MIEVLISLAVGFIDGVTAVFLISLLLGLVGNAIGIPWKNLQREQETQGSFLFFLKALWELLSGLTIIPVAGVAAGIIAANTVIYFLGPIASLLLGLKIGVLSMIAGVPILWALFHWGVLSFADSRFVKEQKNSQLESIEKNVESSLADELGKQDESSEYFRNDLPLRTPSEVFDEAEKRYRAVRYSAPTQKFNDLDEETYLAESLELKCPETCILYPGTESFTVIPEYGPSFSVPVPIMRYMFGKNIETCDRVNTQCGDAKIEDLYQCKLPGFTAVVITDTCYLDFCGGPYMVTPGDVLLENEADPDGYTAYRLLDFLKGRHILLPCEESNS